MQFTGAVPIQRMHCGGSCLGQTATTSNPQGWPTSSYLIGRTRHSCRPVRSYMHSLVVRSGPACAGRQRLDQAECHWLCVRVGDPGLSPCRRPPPALPVSARSQLWALSGRPAGRLSTPAGICVWQGFDRSSLSTLHQTLPTGPFMPIAMACTHAHATHPPGFWFLRSIA